MAVGASGVPKKSLKGPQCMIWMWPTQLDQPAAVKNKSAPFRNSEDLHGPRRTQGPQKGLFGTLRVLKWPQSGPKCHIICVMYVWSELGSVRSSLKHNNRLGGAGWKSVKKREKSDFFKILQWVDLGSLVFRNNCCAYNTRPYHAIYSISYNTE